MNGRDFCILYVDDDENDIRLVKFAAEGAGITRCLQIVNSGPEAMEYMHGEGLYSERGKFPLPTLVLLDLRMPRMNGLDVLQWIRTQPELVGIVVIIFTASAHPDDVKRAWELGANAFVQKPSTFRELTQFLKLVKAFWGDFHQIPPVESESHFAELPKPDLNP